MNVEDKALFDRLRSEVAEAIETFTDPMKLKPRTEPMGHPNPDDFFTERLAEMRNHFTEPHWIEVAKRDSVKECRTELPAMMRCVALTRPEADLRLAYSPDHDENLLVQDWNNGFTSIAIWGDAVGCYAAM